MKNALDKINSLIAFYGLEPFTYEELREYKSLLGISRSRSLMLFSSDFSPEPRYIGTAMRLVPDEKSEENIYKNSFGGKIQTSSKMGVPENSSGGKEHLRRIENEIESFRSMADEKESFRRLRQKITEMEAATT